MRKFKFLLVYFVIFWIQATVVVVISFIVIGARPSGLIGSGTLLSFWTSYKITKYLFSKSKARYLSIPSGKTINQSLVRKKVNLLISLCLLSIASIVLENSDGLEIADTYFKKVGESISGIAFSLIISGLIFGIMRLLGRQTPFIIVCNIVNYSLAIFILLILSLKYL